MEIVNSNSNKDKGKSELVNKYAILDSVAEETDSFLSDQVKLIGEDIVVGIKKAQVASSGVVELMKTLKTKRKGPIVKGKKDKAGLPASRDQSSFPSQ